MKKQKIDEVEYMHGVAYTARTRIPEQAKKLIGRQDNVGTSWMGILMIVIISVNLAILIWNLGNTKETPECKLERKTDAILEAKEGIITAYNVGIVGQTDNTPCTSAYNQDICQLVEQGIGIVANNCLPENTEVEIEGLGRFVVLDRKNARYGCEYFDIAMPADQVIEAIQFGEQKRKVKIYE